MIDIGAGFFFHGISAEKGAGVQLLPPAPRFQQLATLFDDRDCRYFLWSMPFSEGDTVPLLIRGNTVPEKVTIPSINFGADVMEN